MLFIDDNGVTDPTINLAFEKYCYRNLDSRHDYVLFYINEPSIIIKHLSLWDVKHKPPARANVIHPLLKEPAN